MSLLLRSFRVDWLVAETSRQWRHFALTLQLVMWIRTTFFAVCVHRLTCPTNGYFLGQDIDRILLFRIPTEGIPEEGVAGGGILASRVPICGRKEQDEERLQASDT